MVCEKISIMHQRLNTSTGTSVGHTTVADNGTIAVTVVIEEDGYAPISVDGALLNLFIDRLEVCVPETKFTVKIYLRDVYRLQPLDHSPATNSPELVFFTGHFAPRRYILKAYGPGSTTSLKMLYDMIRGKVQHRDTPDFPFARTDVHRQAAERIFGSSAPLHNAAAWGSNAPGQYTSTAPPINLEDLADATMMPSMHGAFDWGVDSRPGSMTTSRSASVKQPPPFMPSSSATTHGAATAGATNLSSLWNASSGRRLPPDVGGGSSSSRLARRSPYDALKKDVGTFNHSNLVDEGTSPIAAASTHSVSFVSPGDSPPGHTSSSRRTAAAVGTQSSFRNVTTTAVGTDSPIDAPSAHGKVVAVESIGMQTTSTIPLTTPSRDESTVPPTGPVAAPSAPLWFLRRNVEKMHQTDVLLHRTPADVRSQQYNDIIALADHVSGNSRRWTQDNGIHLPADAFLAHEANMKAQEFRLPVDAPSASHPYVSTTDFSFTPISARRGDGGLVMTPSTTNQTILNDIGVGDEDMSVEQAERRLQSKASLAALHRKTSNVRRDDVLRSLLEESNASTSATAVTTSSPRKMNAPLTRAVTTFTASAETSTTSVSQRAATFVAVPAAASPSSPLVPLQKLPSPFNASLTTQPIAANQESVVAVRGGLHAPLLAEGTQKRAATGIAKQNGSPPQYRPPPRVATSAMKPNAALGTAQTTHAAAPLPSAAASSTGGESAHPRNPTMFKTYTGIPHASSFSGEPTHIIPSHHAGGGGHQGDDNRGHSVSSNASSSSEMFFSVGGQSQHAGGSPPAAVPVGSGAAAASPPSSSQVLAPKVRPLASKIIAMGGVPMPHLQQETKNDSPPPAHTAAAAHASSVIVVKKVAPPPMSRMPHTSTATNIINTPQTPSTGPLRPSLDGAPTLLRRVATTR
ncbi:Hypothetical protein, putative [Bodo saltans]|uniref:Uncharacterized protein n=1 Tax=Bodo saltans TaxID=75058 RepID=A0A0S4KME6_BODSA|nr:Hypothetical protein, putative [Bodo saltans]|eukprot:CUI14665.1 Hypothetical protein, putative [Bodo saltans]